MLQSYRRFVLILVTILVPELSIGCTPNQPDELELRNLIFTEINNLDTKILEANRITEDTTIYVTPGEPTQIIFPSKILGGFKRKVSQIALDRVDNLLTVFAMPELPKSGEAMIVNLQNGDVVPLRFRLSSEQHQRDAVFEITDIQINSAKGAER